MTYRTDKFEAGDLVTWADDHYANLVNSRAKFGDGPFTVISVENPEYDSYDYYSDTRSQSNWSSMGHTQHLNIDCGHFSGAFFKKV